MDRIVPDLEPGDYWLFAQELLPRPHDGVDQRARELVEGFVLRVLAEDMAMPVESHAPTETCPTGQIEFYYRCIFVPGTETIRNCAVALLFMIKNAVTLSAVLELDAEEVD